MSVSFDSKGSLPAIIVALLVSLAPLSQNAAGNVTFPASMVTESVPAGAGCTVPTPATTFWSSDPGVTIWFQVNGANAGDQPSVRWYSPNGSLYFAYTWPFLTSSGSFCLNSQLPLAGHYAATLPGLWTASVYWNGVLGVSQTFTLTAVSLKFDGSMPHLASAGGWDTSLTLVNLGSSPAQASLNFFADAGSSLMLPFTFPQSPSTPVDQTTLLDQTLNPGTVAQFETTGPASQAVNVGWTQLLSSGNVGGFAIFKNLGTGQEAVVPLETRNAGSYLLAFDDTGSLATGLAIANIATQPASVPVVIRDDNGVQIGISSLNLPAQGHTSFMLSGTFAATAGKRGTVEFDTPSGGQISLLGLRANGAALTTLPVLANVSSGGGSMAQVASGGGWQTTFTLVNTGNIPATSTLNFYDNNGNPLWLPLTLVQSGVTITAPTLTRPLAPGASLIVLTANAASVMVGQAQLVTTGNVGGFAAFRYNPTGQEAVVPLETGNAAAYALAFDNANGLATGVALANTSNQAVNVPVILRDDTGASLGMASVNLAAEGHTSFMLNQTYSGTAGKRGTVEFDAPAGTGISALGLRATPAGALTTIPTLVTTSTTGVTPAPGSFTLSIRTAGTGGGVVTASPLEPAYPAGTLVTLQAVPSTGSSFAGWSAPCSGTGGCSVTMINNTTVTATFNLGR